MPISYTKLTYQNDGPPAIDATNLNKNETAIDLLVTESNANASTVANHETRLDDAEPVIANHESRLDAAEPKIDVLEDFRLWDSGRTYAQNEPAFRNGVPYRSLANGNVGNDPETNPDDWEVVGGGGSGGSENFLKNDLTKANTAYVTKSAGVTSFAWDTSATAQKLLTAGALKVVVPNTGTRTLDIDLKSLDPNNMGQPFSVKFSYLQDAAADNVVVSLYDGTTDTLTAIGTLPQAGATMQTVSGAVFPTTVTATQRLRFTFSGATPFNFYLADVSVAPFVATSGAAISTTQTYALTIGATTTPPTKGTVVKDVATWARRGDKMHLTYKFEQSAGGNAGSGSYLFPLPTGFSIDTAKCPPLSVVGAAKASNVVDETNAITVDGTMVVYGSQALLMQYKLGTSATEDVVTVGSGNRHLGAACYLTYTAEVPIANWTANVNLATDFTEYASNSSNTNADDTTSFVYGPDGSIGVIGVTTLTAVRAKRVRFIRPIQPSDLIVVEFYNPTNNRWQAGDVRAGSHVLCNHYANTSGSGGVTLTQINATDVDVNFHQYPYGTTVAEWSNAAYSSYRWRVRKVSNGNMAEQPPIVYAEYSADKASTTGNPIDWDVKIEDTHNAVTTGAAWRFTAPVPGVYHVDFSAYMQSTSNVTLAVYKNGTLLKNLFRQHNETTSQLTRSTFKVRLGRGDYFDIRGDGATVAGVTRYIEIARIGA